MTFWSRKPGENLMKKKPTEDWDIDWNMEGGKKRWENNER